MNRNRARRNKGMTMAMSDRKNMRAAAQLLPSRQRGPTTSGIHRFMCKGCGLTWVAVRQPHKPCAECSGEVFFMDCNIVQIGRAKELQAVRNVAWRKHWREKMAIRYGRDPRVSHSGRPEAGPVA